MSNFWGAYQNGLEITSTYFVGEYENALIWNLKIKSNSDRKITVFPYVELGMKIGRAHV